MRLPDTIDGLDARDTLLSHPSTAAIDAMQRLESDLLVPRRRGQDGAEARAHGDARIAGRRVTRRVIGRRDRTRDRGLSAPLGG